MARPSVHDPAAILDAALSLVLDGGAAAATVAAIAGRSGAPTGSIYHRFGSREDLLARLWVRAARRSQESFLTALEGPQDPQEATVEGPQDPQEATVEGPQDAQEAAVEGPRDPQEAAVAAGLSVLEFAAGAPGDARLLVCLRREDLLGTPADPALRHELERLNEPVRRAVGELAGRLVGGRPGRAARELTALATIDLPQGAVRRHLAAGRRPPPSLRQPLERAIRAAIADIERRPG